MTAYAASHTYIGKIIMTQSISLKRSSVAGKAPKADQLELGELALNTNDGKLYSKKSNGSDSIFEIGKNPSLKNKVINGDFDFWQRATSQTTVGVKSADRWFNNHSGSTKTVTRQTFTAGQTDVPNNPKYFLRTVVSSVAGAANFVSLQQYIENVAVLSGKTATLSFWAKADTTRPISVNFSQYFGSTGSTQVNIEANQTKVNLTTTWQKFVFTVKFPSVSGKTIDTSNDRSLFTIWLSAGSDFDQVTKFLGQQSGTFDIAQVQLEEGAVSSDFDQRPAALEILLCQRYYEAGDGTVDIWSGSVTSGNVYSRGVNFKVNKRVIPTITLTAAGESSFNTSRVLQAANAEGFRFSATATATASAGSFQTSWTADAEL